MTLFRTPMKQTYIYYIVLYGSPASSNRRTKADSHAQTQDIRDIKPHTHTPERVHNILAHDICVNNTSVFCLAFESFSLSVLYADAVRRP